MKPEHRARLLQLATRRGEKGFSKPVADAIEAYLERETDGPKARQKALAMRGTLSAKEADRLRRHVAGLRENWG